MIGEGETLLVDAGNGPKLARHVQERLEGAEKALGFCLSAQLMNTEDPNLEGAVLERVLPPRGSDASPYHLRDLGTIFSIQAACAYLRLEPSRPRCCPWSF